MPLIGRVGEHFKAGCVVDVLVAVTIKVSISLLGASSDSLILHGPKEQVVDVAPGRPLEVLWPFTVVAIGDAQVQFTAVPAGAPPRSDKKVKSNTSTTKANGDAFLYELPLLSLQQPVTLSTSFVLLANKSFTRWTEGFAFPPAIPSTGSVQLAAGVGHYSTQQVLAHGIDRYVTTALQKPLRNWPDAFALAASLAPPAVTAAYGGQSVNASANLLMHLSLRLLAAAYTDSNGLEQRPVHLEARGEHVSRVVKRARIAFSAPRLKHGLRQRDGGGASQPSLCIVLACYRRRRHRRHRRRLCRHHRRRRRPWARHPCFDRKVVCDLARRAHDLACCLVERCKRSDWSKGCEADTIGRHALKCDDLIGRR